MSLPKHSYAPISSPQFWKFDAVTGNKIQSHAILPHKNETPTDHTEDNADLLEVPSHLEIENPLAELFSLHRVRYGPVHTTLRQPDHLGTRMGGYGRN